MQPFAFQGKPFIFQGDGQPLAIEKTKQFQQDFLAKVANHPANGMCLRIGEIFFQNLYSLVTRTSTFFLENNIRDPPKIEDTSKKLQPQSQENSDYRMLSR